MQQEGITLDHRKHNAMQLYSVACLMKTFVKILQYSNFQKSICCHQRLATQAQRHSFAYLRLPILTFQHKIHHDAVIESKILR